MCLERLLRSVATSEQSHVFAPIQKVPTLMTEPIRTRIAEDPQQILSMRFGFIHATFRESDQPRFM